jgi:hypothetical protein
VRAPAYLAKSPIGSYTRPNLWGLASATNRMRDPRREQQPQGTNDAAHGGAPRSIATTAERLSRKLHTIRDERRSMLMELGYTERDAEELEEECKLLAAADTPRRRANGRAGRNIVADAQLRLFEQEQRGDFYRVPITPQQEFPTLLTRLPLFVPGLRSTAAEELDEDRARPFTTPWGSGRQFGAPLTVYDEDTLIALTRLRQSLLVGEGDRLPKPVSAVSAANREVHVHAMFVLLSQVQAFCGGSQGGRNTKLRMASIKRLAATRIEFSNKSEDKLIGKGTTIGLIDVAWETYYDESMLYVQFTPVMAAWLESAYSFIDWEIRRKLSAPGKAIHRFLSGQRRGQYAIYIDKLMNTIGYPRDIKYFARDLRQTMAQLQELGWVSRWRIDGTGRNAPLKLVVERDGPTAD